MLSALALALLGAALGDPLVESISNTGVFGAGLRDDSHQSVVPALIFGLALALLVFVFRMSRSFGGPDLRRTWGSALLSGLERVSVFRNVAPIFGAQLAFVGAMEWCEQALGFAGTIHGLSWLGAPIFFSLLMHFAVCALTLYAVRRLSYALLHYVLAIVAALDRVLAALSRDALRRECTHSRKRLAVGSGLLAARRLRGRAPPILPTLV